MLLKVPFVSKLLRTAGVRTGKVELTKMTDFMVFLQRFSLNAAIRRRIGALHDMEG